MVIVCTEPDCDAEIEGFDVAEAEFLAAVHDKLHHH